MIANESITEVLVEGVRCFPAKDSGKGVSYHRQCRLSAIREGPALNCVTYTSVPTGTNWEVTLPNVGEGRRCVYNSTTSLLYYLVVAHSTAVWSSYVVGHDVLSACLYVFVQARVLKSMW